MRGATAPRLLLELICARVLLPGADHSTEGVQARLDRLERRMTITAGDAPPPPSPVERRRDPEPTSPVEQPASPVEPHPSPVERSRDPEPQPSPVEPHAAPVEPPASPVESRDPEPEPIASAAPVTETAAGSPLSLVDVRRLWPDIVEATKQRRRVTWIHLTQHAQVVAVDAQILTLGFSNAGARESFDSGGSAEIVRQAAIDVVGHDWRVETIVDPGAEPAAAPPPAAPVTAAPPEPPPVPASPAVTDEAAAEPAGSPSATARQAIAPTRAGGRDDSDQPPTDSDGGARPDDDDAESSGLDGAQLLQQALGAQVIEEIPHQ